MTMENLMSLQSWGSRKMGEPLAARPAGVHQGAVLVVLDVNKGVHPAALYWALSNVVRKGDTVKILGIITHIPNSLGFMMRVDQSIRNSPNIMELQFEIATKKEAIWRTNHINEWSRKAGVKMDVDVKVGNNPKVIATDEAKAMGAYHVVLDKNMKKDRKYFIDNLTCFVSRFRSSGGVDSIRSYVVTSSKLPPLTPKGSAVVHASQLHSQPGHRSKGSNVSSGSSGRRSSMSSTSFELGGESSDESNTQDGDPLSAPSTGESMERPVGPELERKILSAMAPAAAQTAQPKLFHLLRGPVRDAGEKFYGVKVNPLRNPAAISRSDFDQGPCTPRQGSQRIGQPQQQQVGSVNGWMGTINVAPEMGRSKMGRQSLATTLQTQASFNGTRKTPERRADKISMDMHWPLMHLADCQRESKLRRDSNGVLHHFASHSFRRRARFPAAAGLNYGDMIDSD